jgi:hypothetical protein
MNLQLVTRLIKITNMDNGNYEQTTSAQDSIIIQQQEQQQDLIITVQ